ncbi:MAG: transcription elongation factor GreA [Oscillospiraceae bacterium]
MALPNELKQLKMTKQGFDELVNELEYLKSEKRAEISDKIKTARGFGDLSENSEYDEAKNEQAVVENRILTLESQIHRATIIKQSEISSEIVSIGCKITIRDVEFDDILEYRMASSVESNSDMGSITDESPVGKALLGHRVGELINVTVPSGAEIAYEIMKIEI